MDRALNLGLLAIVACSPIVDEGVGEDVREGPQRDQEVDEVDDLPTYLERDDQVYRELVTRCGCDGTIYDDYDWRLQVFQSDLNRLRLTLDVECAADRFEALSAEGCGIEPEVFECEVLRGTREVGEPCTQGIWLDDCAPGLYCWTGRKVAPAQGVCHEQVSLGGACGEGISNFNNDCGEGTCVDGECRDEASQPGDTCWLRCGPGLICDDGTCRGPVRCDGLPYLP